MPTYQEMLEQLAAREDEKKKLRDARDEKEMAEKVFPLLSENPDFEFLHAPYADPEYPAHFVLRPPTPGEVNRFRHTMWRDAKDHGAIEAKSKASAELGTVCLQYPSREEYQRVCARYGNLASEVGTKAWKMAEAGADALAKK